MILGYSVKLKKSDQKCESVLATEGFFFISLIVDQWERDLWSLHILYKINIKYKFVMTFF